MKVLVEYDPVSLAFSYQGDFIGSVPPGVTPTDHKEESIVLDLIKQGVTPDQIIKLKNNDLI